MNYHAYDRGRSAACSLPSYTTNSRRAAICRVLLIVAVLAAATWFDVSLAQAADNGKFTVTVGTKEWVTNWTSWRINSVFFGAGRIQVSEPVHSATRLTSTPQISVRYGDLFVSASYLVSQSYSLTGSLESLTASRHEVDANVGYYLLPGLAVTAGYKQIAQDYGGGAFNWKGPTVGLAGSAPLGNTSFAIYGLVGYGYMRLSVPFETRDDAGDTRFNADYSLVEAGAAYVMGGGRIFDSLRVTASYRAQILNTRGYKLYFGPNASTSPSERDFTQGPTLGISASF